MENKTVGMKATKPATVQFFKIYCGISSHACTKDIGGKTSSKIIFFRKIHACPRTCVDFFFNFFFFVKKNSALVR